MLFSSSVLMASTSPPTNLTCTAVGTTGIKVNWTIPANSNVAGYTLRYSTNAAFSNPSPIYRWVGGGNTNLTYTITGLNANTTYYIQVKSEGTSDTYDSPFSSTISFMISGGTTSTGISNLTGTALSTSSIQVNWTNASSGPSYSGYTVRYSISSNFSSGVVYKWNGGPNSNTALVLTGLIANTQYFIQVKGEGVNGIPDSPFTNSVSCSTTGATTIGLPQFDHIVYYVMENHSYSQIVGNSSAPNFNSLITGTKSALFTQSYATTHPSQPNYLMLFSGSNQGVTSNTCPVGPFNAGNIFQQLGSINKTYASYSQSIASVGSTACYNGAYSRKHNPWTNFNNVNHSTEYNTNSFPVNNFSSLPYLSFVIPDDDHNWHNDDLGAADNFLNSSGILAYAAWAKANNSLLIVTFDEDDGSSSNRIATIFTGAYVNKASYSQTINHYSVLRLLEDMNNLPRLGNASSASSIDFCWSSTPFAPILKLKAPENIVSTEIPTSVYFYDLSGKLFTDTLLLPHDQIIIRREISGDAVKTRKFVIN